MNYYFKHVVSFYMMIIIITLHANEKSQSLSLAQNILIGGIVGAAEVLFPGQPLSFAMNHAINQKSKPVAERTPINWRNSYQGFTVNALGQMPITAVQKVVQAKGSEYVEKTQGQSLLIWQKMLISYMSGVAGALIDTPSNAIQLHLQKNENVNKNTLHAVKDLGKYCWRGFAPNAFLKEGPFTVGYQMLAGEGEKIARKYFDNNLAAIVLGGAGAGIITAVVTHPGAVLRNKMQDDISQSIRQIFKKILKEEGWRGLFSGLSARGTRVAFAVPLYAAYSSFLEAQIKQ